MLPSRVFATETVDRLVTTSSLGRKEGIALLLADFHPSNKKGFSRILCYLTAFRFEHAHLHS